MKEDWSLSAHYFAEIEEQQGDETAVDNFAKDLVAGKVDLNKDEHFTAMMDTFDVLMEYNYAKDAPTSAEREVSEQKLAEGEVAFMFGGTWDWAQMAQYNYTENIGMMPVPTNATDGSNEKLVGGASKYLFIDSSDNTSDEQVQAAKDFINWLLTDAEGVSFISDTCALIPASKTDAEISLSMIAAAKKYFDDGNVLPNYNYNPDDMITNVGASMQKYLAGEVDRAGLAKEITDYFSKASLVEH
jgi:raffinose/stachyose/melibiose transport system substrate-binding protein